MPNIYWAIFLFLFGLLLVCLEAFIPSMGVLGILAGIVLLVSIYLGFQEGWVEGFCLLLSAVIVIPILFWMFAKWWPLTPLGKRILGSSPDHPDELLPDGESHRLVRSLLGKQGTAVSDLLPNGRIDIDGMEFDAVSEGILVDAGTIIEVTEVEGNRITVRPIASSPRVVSDPIPGPGEESADLSKPTKDLEVDPFDDPLA